MNVQEAARTCKLTTHRLTEYCRKNVDGIIEIPNLGKMKVSKKGNAWQIFYADKENKDSYNRDKRNALIKAKYAETKDIGNIPPVKDPERRARCSQDLACFLKTYMEETYILEWSKDHITVIRKIEKCILSGGLFSIAMPRGSGKTSVIEGATIWATLYGYRKYPVLIGSSAIAAQDLLASIKIELETNDLLCEDFPEVCYPFQKLEGISLRCKGQTYGGGVRTFIDYKTDKIVFPTIGGSAASGTILECRGLTGNLRGMKHKKTDGEVMRPDLALLDDCQTDESAVSPSQCDKRESLINSAVLGLAGHKKQIAGFMLCTIIHRNDLSARLLDHQKNPQWQGETAKLIYKFPDTQKTLWREYADLRNEGILDGDQGAKANQFYISNRVAMDAGAIVAWDERKYPTEISALQHIENLLIERGEEAFYAEFQNDPVSRVQSIYEVNEEIVLKRLNSYDRYIVPDNCNFLTVGIDINYIGLHYQVIASTNDGTGYIVDYGKYPGHDNDYLFDSKKTSGTTEAQAIYQGVYQLIDELVNIKRFIQKGGQKNIDGILVDCGGTWMKVVFNVCRQLNMSMPVPVMCSRGRYNKGYNPTRTIGKIGENWFKTKFVNMDDGQVIVHNSDIWRMRYQKAFLSAPGAPGSISIYGKEKKQHKKLAEHICSEILTEFVRGDVHDYYTWDLRVGYKNDLLDAGVIAYVASQVAGSSVICGNLERNKQIRKRQNIAKKHKGKVSYN